MALLATRPSLLGVEAVAVADPILLVVAVVVALIAHAASLVAAEELQR